jgi:pyruvate/2-oxoglutarate dehydrogenase complex dihydrolipoamide acyltransferase (E2) component
MARPRSTLTKFILSLPRTLSVKEVIAKSKAKGMKASENNVYRIRRTFGTKAASTATAKPADAKSKPAASPPSKSNAPSKSDFIREQPATLSAAEVVAKAKAAGIRLDSFLVYKVRSRASAKGKTKVAAKKIVATPPKAAPAKKRRLKSKPASVPVQKASNGTSRASATRSSSAEDLLRAVAAEMGLGKAIELLAGERARVQSILKG